MLEKHKKGYKLNFADFYLQIIYRHLLTFWANWSACMTSGKLKSMMQPIGSLADSAFDNIEEIIKESPEIDVKPIFQG